MVPPTPAEIVGTAAMLRARIDALLAELHTLGPRPRAILGISLIAEELGRLREVADVMASPRSLRCADREPYSSRS